MSSSPTNTSPPTRFQSLGHLELLLMLLALLVIQSFLSTDSAFQAAIFHLLFLGVVLSAIRTLSDSRVRMVAALTIALFAYAFSWADAATGSAVFLSANYFCRIFVFAILLMALVESVFRDGAIDSNRIIGAISIYLVLGLIFAMAYSLLETLQPGAFAVARDEASHDLSRDLVSNFIYFSSVTLTTLGYGDIVPASRPARMFATLEATIGQLYIAIVIARLVGLHITQKR